MRINFDSNYNTPISFSSWRRCVYKDPKASFKELAYRNDTSIFRDDLLWDDFIKFLKFKYEDLKKVNVYNYACSNGSESFSLVMKMLSCLGKKDSEKFFPIIAKDVDSLAIENAKSNSIPIDWFEKSKINLHTDNNFAEYFTKDFSSNWYDGETVFYCPVKELTENVRFSKGDIMKDYKRIEPENSVVLARNFWPYLLEDIPRLILRLAEQMGKNSTLVIGGFDVNGCKNYNIDLRQELLKKGFVATDDPLVFTKHHQLRY